jgi:hypothetical protein
MAIRIMVIKALKQFAFASVFLPTIVLAKSNLHSAEQLEKHLINGCDVRAIIETKYCTGENANGESISNMDLAPFNIYSVPDATSFKKV